MHDRACLVGQVILVVQGEAGHFARRLQIALEDVGAETLLALTRTSQLLLRLLGSGDRLRRRASAVERLLIALEFAGDDPLLFNIFMGLGCAHFHLDRNVKATQWFERAVAENPSAAWAHLWLCPAYVYCGRKQEARWSLSQLQYLDPNVTISSVIGGFGFLTQPLRDRIAGGLETMGVPQ
jgi:Flp pilus assembly protein TadD